MKRDTVSTVLLSVMVSFVMIFATASMVFAYKLDDIKAAIESKGAKWKAGETSVSKLSDTEKKLRLGLVKQTATGQEKILSLGEPLTGLPTSLDWRSNTRNYVTDVRDQGDCGSCWASQLEVAQGMKGALINPGKQTGPAKLVYVTKALRRLS